jgi:hypothetical protein
MSRKLFSLLISYCIIFVGLGILTDVLITKNAPSVLLPFRFFYWSINGITFLHLALLVPYRKMQIESKKTSWIFFLSINHFILSLLAILIYALVFYKRNELDGLVAILIYIPLFIFFIAVLMQQSKE